MQKTGGRDFLIVQVTFFAAEVFPSYWNVIEVNNCLFVVLSQFHPSFLILVVTLVHNWNFAQKLTLVDFHNESCWLGQPIERMLTYANIFLLQMVAPSQISDHEPPCLVLQSTLSNSCWLSISIWNVFLAHHPGMHLFVPIAVYSLRPKQGFTFAGVHVVPLILTFKPRVTLRCGIPSVHIFLSYSFLKFSCLRPDNKLIFDCPLHNICILLASRYTSGNVLLLLFLAVLYPSNFPWIISHMKDTWEGPLNWSCWNSVINVENLVTRTSISLH